MEFLIGRRVVMHRWRDSEDDELLESPRPGMILAVNFVGVHAADGDPDGDYLLLIAFDDGGLGTAMAPNAVDRINRFHLKLVAS